MALLNLFERPRVVPLGPILPFAPYEWFHLRGFAEARTELSAEAAARDRRRLISDKEIKFYCERAVRAVPHDWINSYPGGDWNKFNQAQLKNAIMGRPLCLDKAALSYLALLELMRDVTGSTDIIDNVKIDISNVVLFGFDQSAWQSIQAVGDAEFGREFLFKLCNETCQEAAFFDYLAVYIPATELSVLATLDFIEKHKLNRHLRRPLRVQRLRERADPNYRPLPSIYQKENLKPNRWELCSAVQRVRIPATPPTDSGINPPGAQGLAGDGI